MPASTLDPVNAALRSSLGERSATKEVALDTHISLSTNKALLSTIKFEPSGTYQSTVSDKLKFKYGNQKNNQQSSKLDKNINMGAGETLTLAKYVLYPIESVQLGWNNTDWSVGAGMVNMGNTCYLNSTLQALFHVPALVNWLISDKQHTAECDDTESGCIICAMRKTLQDSQQRSTNTIRPFLIYNKLRIVCRNLIPGRQEDAHEFLRYLVEAMEKAYLSRFKNHSEFDSRTKETTPLNQILGGYLRSAVRCLECSHVSTTFQHFQDLLLDIRKAQTLEEALDTYFSREKLDDESYQCEACHKKVPATKQFFLERAPMVLCIQLKRFSISNNKITKHVQFRQKLELTKYSRHKPATSLVYKLVALVTHMGPTVNCGHYTAVAQAPCGNFYQFDDSMVRPISHQAVFNTNAYIMLYELESSPFSPKAQASHKAAKSQPVNGNCSKSILSEISPKTNGITSSKVYGPQLPPPVKQENDENNSVTNGNESSTKTETDQQQNKTASSPVNKVKMYATYSNQTFNYNSVLNSNVKKEKNMPELEPDQDSTTKQLVPYEMDDSSSCSEEPPLDSRIVTKVSSSKNWKTNCSTSNRDSSAGSDKVKFQNDIKTSVNELLKMSHGGYSAPVSTWNGTRAQLDKEISNERREERKRALADSEDDEDRVKHQKVNANGTYKSNPGYNPIQEFHNAKNWNKSNSSYHNSNNNNNNNNNRQFFNNNRHRRNGFHHKAYHKNNYRFRQ